MNEEKQIYIEKQVDIDYILKSKNSALAFLFVSILFLFIHRIDGIHNVYVNAVALGIVVLSLIRLINVKRHTDKKIETLKAVQVVSFTAVLNAILWSAVGFISIITPNQDNFQILIIFIILISFSAGSIVTLSHKKIIFYFVTCIVLSPQAFHAYYEYMKSHDLQAFWLWGYTAINIAYNLRQGKTINSELRRRFSFEYDLKQSMEEIALSKKHLEEESIKTFHASRLSSLGEMAGGVAHEINNPLTIIQGMTKSIISHDDLKIDEQIRIKLSKINSATERIAKIVKGMKIISSKNDQIVHEVVKINKILEISLGLFEEKFKNENINFHLENPDDPSVLCNPLQISQIIINLLNNAIDALLKSQENYLLLKVTEDKNNHTVDIRIVNSGPLIDSAVSAKIFEPFFTTKSIGKGTGLGLSISQTLAHSNDGNLSYEAYDGKVCFKLHLHTHTDI